jgi:hypothetical protein
MSLSMPPNSTCSRVSGTRHGFSGGAGSRSLNRRHSCDDCAARHPATRNSGIHSRHNRMTEVGLFHKTPTPDLAGKFSYRPAGNPY